MELKPGYKETDVGIIPKDWEVIPLGEGLSNGPDYGINAPAVPHSDRLPAYIRITDITKDGKYNPSNPVSVESTSFEDFYLEDGDIVFARTGASVGKSYEYRPSDGRLVFAGFLIRVHPDSVNLHPSYVAAYLTTGPYWGWVQLMSMRSGQPGISAKEYALLPIPKPPMTEQLAITTILSDVDTLLEGLDRLIAKKRNLKQAAMQQLLTGESRLPGFTGKWKAARLGQYGKTYGGLTGKSKEDFIVGTDTYIEFLDVINSTAISGGEFPKVQLSTGERQNRVQRNDLLFNGSSETPEEVGLCAAVIVDLENTYLNSFCFGYRLMMSDQIDPIFMAALIRSGEGRERIKHLAQGATRYNLSKMALLELELNLPCYDEQKAIATVLSDMDADIVALEQRRNKTKDIKQAMMQELLTGKTRLVTPGGSHA